MPTTDSAQLVMPTTVTKATNAQRQAALDDEVARLVAAGNRVEARSDFQAVVVYGKPVNHLLHALLTLVTFGLWSIGWAIIAYTCGEIRSVISVDDAGIVRRS